ncbi:MAG: FIG00638667: hypothetical protein [uncultured Chloroflexia bacterium]|uniref:ATP-grasp domain-containing protein n=1 Tax=uncultured Chloroflexia bacterium TaxID=1672391 RepID=A0A6J4IKH2_9CHLR|nr:MAG: FIG00638667: hypothetical protein [uncultured Chloroflexia bacterium]
MSPSASRPGRTGNIVVVGNPDGRRVELFQAALCRLGLPPACTVAYTDLLAGRRVLPEVVREGDIVRIESPGKDWAVEQALLVAGADLVDRSRFEHLPREAILRMPFDRGRILPSRQWYRGWCALLQTVAHQLRECPPHRLMLSPDDIAIMFDKPACHARLQAAGIAVPPSLGEVDSFHALAARMESLKWPRVFVKLAHGSSASGAVALETSRERMQAFSTVEVVESSDGLTLYNSRRLQTYRRPAEIARLIDALCRHRIHVERWLPKAGIAGRTFDLRVVVIAGQARHVVVRMSRGPMTNLHLLNARGDIDAVAARMGVDAWAAARETCEHAMACFPDSLYGGIDLLVEPGYRRHAVLEVNAFGDLLPDVVWQGQDTYMAEVNAMQHVEAGVSV